MTLVSLQAEFTAMRDQYMRAGEGFIICYSITDRRSFHEVREFKQLIYRVRRTDDTPVVLVGNKSDLNLLRQVRQGWKTLLAAFLCCKMQLHTNHDNFPLQSLRSNVRGRPGPCKLPVSILIPYISGVSNSKSEGHSEFETPVYSHPALPGVIRSTIGYESHQKQKSGLQKLHKCNIINYKF